MKVKKCLSKKLCENNMVKEYFYRIIEGNFYGRQAYGIEVERHDFEDGTIINIERDSINIISVDEEEACNILDMLCINNVSPIHLIDILGEISDKCVSEFN